MMKLGADSSSDALSPPANVDDADPIDSLTNKLAAIFDDEDRWLLGAANYGYRQGMRNWLFKYNLPVSDRNPVKDSFTVHFSIAEADADDWLQYGKRKYNNVATY